ncbi:XRE family transcriptional regulator, partial [Tritonibacter sp. SIMBA_163]
GEIQQTLDGPTFAMTSGHSLHYRGNTPHASPNPTDRTARILWTGTLTVLNRKGALEPPELSHKQNA